MLTLFERLAAPASPSLAGSFLAAALLLCPELDPNKANRHNNCNVKPTYFSKLHCTLPGNQLLYCPELQVLK